MFALEKGTRIFEDQQDLNLVEATAFENGVALVRYEKINDWLPSSTVTRPDFDSYLICATPRSGSTLLCGLLESSGVAGHPASYFNRDGSEWVRRRLAYTPTT